MERTRVGRTSIGVISAVIVLLGSSAWVNRVDAQAPPAAGQAIPRTPDGKPDLSGVWQALNSAAWDIQDHHAQAFPWPPATVRHARRRASSKATRSRTSLGGRKRENYEKRATADPEAKCFLPGVPRITYMPLPFQIVQTPRAHRDARTSTSHAFRNISRDRTQAPEGAISNGGSAIRAAAGTATRSSSTSSTSTIRPGSTGPAISTAMRSTWSSATRRWAATTSLTR